MRYVFSIHALMFLLAIAVFSVGVQGQSRFSVNGRLKIEGSDLSGARVVIYKEGVKERSITSNLGKFSLDLDLNANYILSFEKDGYVTKKLSFNTRVPADAAGQGFAPFDFSVSLFKQYDDVNTVVFNQPVGVIRYDRSLGDFDYDTDYTKSIQGQMQQAVADVEKRQKEEAANASAEAKRKAAEDKARAKEEAEARKQQEAEQRAQREREAAERKATAAQNNSTPPPAVHVPPPPPPPAPVVVAPPKPKPVPVDNKLASAVAGQEQRRTLQPVVGQEARPEVTVYEPETFRHEELVIEPNKVTTIIELDTDGVRTQYRRVVHKWGDTYYFKNEQSISRTVYEREALGDRLVMSVPGR